MVQSKTPPWPVLAELMELKTYLESGEIHYSKLIPTGDCPQQDYGYGFLDVMVCPGIFEGRPGVRIWFDTADDGDYGGWAWTKTIGDARDLAKNIMEKVFLDLWALPHTDAMNKLLSPFGIRVDFE